MGLIAESLASGLPPRPPGQGISVASGPPQGQAQHLPVPTDHPSVLGFLGNVIGDVQQIGSGIGTLIGAVGHDAVTGLHDVASAAVGNPMKGNYLLDDFAKAVPGAIAADYSNRYGGHGLGEVEHQLYTNPLSYVADALTVLSAGGTLAAEGADVAARAPEVARAMDIIDGATKGMTSTEAVASKVNELKGLADAGKLGVDSQTFDRAAWASKVKGMPQTIVDRYGGGLQTVDPAWNPYRRAITTIGNKIGTESYSATEGKIATLRVEAETSHDASVAAKANQLEASLRAAKSAGLPGVQREYWNTVRVRTLTDKLMSTSSTSFLHERTALLDQTRQALDGVIPPEIPDNTIISHIQAQETNLYAKMPQPASVVGATAGDGGYIPGAPAIAPARSAPLHDPVYQALDFQVNDATPGAPLPSFGAKSGPELQAEGAQTRITGHQIAGETFGYDHVHSTDKPMTSLENDTIARQATDPAAVAAGAPDVARAEIVVDHYRDIPSAVAKLGQRVPIRSGYNTLLTPGEAGDRSVRVVADVQGKPMEFRFVTPVDRQVDSVAYTLRDFRDAAKAKLASGTDTPDYYQHELDGATAKLASLNEIKTANLRQEMEGLNIAPMNQANYNLKLLTARFENSMYSGMEGAFTPMKALERQYYPLRMKEGAVYNKKLGTFEGGGSALQHDAELAAQGLPAPVYFPYYDPSRVKSADFLMAKKTIGMRTLTTPKNEKAFTGALAESGAFEHDLVTAYSRRAALAIRKEEGLDLVNKLTSTFGRRINNWDELGKNEQVMAPDGLIRFYRGQIKMSDDIMRAAAKEGGLDVTDESLKAVKDYIVGNQEDFVGLTKQGVELWAVPKVAADRIQKASDRIGGVNMRLFYDTPNQVWRSLVLQGSPRWVVNNLIGNTIFLKMQGAKLWDVVRQLQPSYVDKMRAFIGEDALKQVEGGFFSEYSQRHLGSAIDTPTGAAFKRIGESRAVDTLGTPGRAVQRINSVIEDAYRRASYVSAAEKEGLRAGLTKTGHRFYTSKAALEDVARVGIDPKTRNRAIDTMNYFLNDYQRSTPFGKNVIRRFVVPFWSFYRHVGHLMLTMPFEHPERFNVMRMLSEVGNDMQKDFGPVPPWAHGAVPLGPADAAGDRTFLSSAGPNPFSTLFQTPLDVLHPLWKGVYEQSTGRSSLTGRPFTDPAVYTPFGSDQQYRVTQGPDGNYSAEPVDKTAPSLPEYVAQQIPQYQLLRNLLGGGKPYDTASLPAIAQDAVSGSGHGVIRDPATGAPTYPVSPLEQLLKFSGATTFTVNQGQLAEQSSLDSSAAIRGILRRFGLMPPADATTGAPQVLYSTGSTDTGSTRRMPPGAI